VYKHIFLIHSSVVGHLGCFHSLAIVTSAAVNMGVQRLLLYPDSYSFRYMLRSGVAQQSFKWFKLLGDCPSSVLRMLTKRACN
jgi:hypothetical protein